MRGGAVFCGSTHHASDGLLSRREKLRFRTVELSDQPSSPCVGHSIRDSWPIDSPPLQVSQRIGQVTPSFLCLDPLLSLKWLEPVHGDSRCMGIVACRATFHCLERRRAITSAARSTWTTLDLRNWATGQLGDLRASAKWHRRTTDSLCSPFHVEPWNVCHLWTFPSQQALFSIGIDSRERLATDNAAVTSAWKPR